MTVSRDILFKYLNTCAPASTNAIAAFETGAGFQLPKEYVDFLRMSNGGEGFVGDKPGDRAYIILWPVEELLTLNKAYDVQKYAPGLFLFGSDGGGEAYAFDLRKSSKPIVRVPFVGMALDQAIGMGESFLDFLQTLHRS
jgi:hypothetical protein